MELEESRKEMLTRWARVKPTLSEQVITDAEFEGRYTRPHHCRDKKKLEKFEHAKKKLFCRECLRENNSGMLEAFLLWVEETDNLLENKPEDWIRLQCFNPLCNFELVTPRPQPANTATEIKYQQLYQEMARQQPIVSSRHEAERIRHIAQQQISLAKAAHTARAALGAGAHSSGKLSGGGFSREYLDDLFKK